MSPNIQKLAAAKSGPDRARSDAFVTVAVGSVSWFAIERTGVCARFFAWVAANPETEVDSFILALLFSAVGLAVFAARRYSEMLRQHAAEVRANTLALHDPLTGLLNRRALTNHLESLTSGADEVGLLLVDLDRFKAVNDVHGHLAGDALLIEVAKRIVNTMQFGEVAYRLGGDEFAMVCECKDDHDSPRRAARRLVRAMAEPFECGALTHHIGASIGIAAFPVDAEDRETLMRRADIALYRAKDAGRGQHRSFEVVMDAEISRRAAVELELRAAILARDIHPYYQPLIVLATGATVGFELLARWDRPGLDPIGPDYFVPIAQESGLLTDMTIGLLDYACREARHWDPELTLALNIAPAQLADPWLCTKLLATLKNCGFAPQRLAIEITENALISGGENARCAIESFKHQGIKISLDDFGTGYSSLHNLRMLQFDKLKIDRSFIAAINTDSEVEKIVRAIIALAASLDLPVIAEGIESEEIAARLRGFGCAQGQGFHLGRPMSGAEVRRILSSARPYAWERQYSAPLEILTSSTDRCLLARAGTG